MSKHQKKKGSTKKQIVFANTLVFISISLLLLWSITSYLNIGNSNYTNDAQIEAFITPINSKIQGYINEIRFIEHQKVSKGDTLLIINDSEFKIKITQAEASCLNALVVKELTQAKIQTLSNNIKVKKAYLLAARAQLKNSKQNYDRYLNLVVDDVVTQAQFEQVKSEYNAINAQYQAINYQWTSAQLSLNETSKRLKLNDADIERTKAMLDMCKLNLSYCTIKAPYNGIIGRRFLQDGQLIQAGHKLLHIIKSQEKWVVANFREKQMNNVKIGKEVSVEVDALNGKKYKGIIKAISGASGAKLSAIPIDNSTGNFIKVQQRFPVRIEFTEQNKEQDLELLRVGMNVNITIKDITNG